MPESSTQTGKLRLVLADQLSRPLASLSDIDKQNDLILMAEVRTEASYVKHHKKKIAFLFSAMRHFAKELQNDGYRVRYVSYDDPDNAGSLKAEVERAMSELSFSHVVVTFPGEWRVLEDMQSWQAAFVAYNATVEIREDDRFIASLDEFRHWADGKKQLRMEYFYRELRKKTSVLLQDGEPEGGRWNYDAQNRKSLPKGTKVPNPTMFEPDDITTQVLELVGTEFEDHFGELSNFHYAVTREQALQVLKGFIQERLVLFGDYQDAMQQDEPWMFHSHISFYLNAGLLTAHEVITQVEHAYREYNFPLNAVEGFIRQVLGWREYVRGLYWHEMPKYVDQNFLNAQRHLPDFFWTGDTQMNCLSQCINETKQNAYAHHIQRLMVIGNFLLLTGIEPKQVQEWFLLVYGDAYEWVELPNVNGMILFADGGVMASKPYAASGAYINKMSNYCQSCAYKVKDKNGESACPFNYLYWDFLARNQDKLRGNQRLSMPYRTLEKMDDAKRQLIASDAESFFHKLERNEKV
ncbi:MAG: cryptochrome/photolyase family protein [Oleiphilaceae bacterium]|nr:cryptochrome/photolyase family protein [Oleiphilaceae bacterium]